VRDFSDRGFKLAPEKPSFDPMKQHQLEEQPTSCEIDQGRRPCVRPCLVVILLVVCALSWHVIVFAFVGELYCTALGGRVASKCEYSAQTLSDLYAGAVAEDDDYDSYDRGYPIACVEAFKLYRGACLVERGPARPRVGIVYVFVDKGYDPTLTARASIYDPTLTARVSSSSTEPPIEFVEGRDVRSF
jgi:hypothetical protein